MEGRLTGFSLNRDGSQNVTVTVAADFGNEYDELKDTTVEIQIKKAQKHRSMEANRYAWALIDQIAAKMNMRKSEVYRNAIRDIGGVSRPGMARTEDIPVIRQEWEKLGLGNQVEVVDEEEETGWSSIRLYFGSSTYDTRQMHALLQILIQDAEALGIPTITPAEEERMLGKWAKKKGEKTDGTEHTEGPDQKIS